MMIDTIIDAKEVKFQSPNYYVFMNNIIHSHDSDEEARTALCEQYPELAEMVDDKEWEKLCALYVLYRKVYLVMFQLYWRRKSNGFRLN
jgi:hypothetical protein